MPPESRELYPTGASEVFVVAAEWYLSMAAVLAIRDARARRVFVESWNKNAFDTNYVPVAFAYGQLGPSGFVGESGRPSLAAAAAARTARDGSS